MAHFLLLYDVVPDYAERRGEYRAAHLANAGVAVERGELVPGGALADPYVLNRLVTGWRVQAWTTVAGAGAESSVAV